MKIISLTNIFFSLCWSFFLCSPIASAQEQASVGIYLQRAKLFYEMGEIDNAIKEGRIVLSIEPDNREAQHLLQKIQWKYAETETAYLEYIRGFGGQGFGDGKLSLFVKLAVDDENHLYVADDYGHSVQKVNSEGDWLFSFTGKGRQKDGAYRPTAIVYRNHTLYVGDSFRHAIEHFDIHGTLLARFGGSGSGVEEPSDIAVDDVGNIYLLDAHRSLVQKFNSAGKLLQSFEGEGKNLGNFQNPMSLLLTDKGNLFVVDTGNSRIQQFDSSGRFARQFGTIGEIGKLEEPTDIAQEQIWGRLLITDRKKNAVLGYDEQGHFLTLYPMLGVKLSQPTNLTISPDNLVYIAHKGPNRILVFHHKYARSKAEHFALGQLSFEHSDYDFAIEEFQKAIQLGLNTGDVYFLLGRAYQETQSFHQAIRAFNRVIQLDPAFGQVYFYRGTAYYKQRAYQYAQQDFQQAVHLDPQNIHALNNLGYTYYQLGQSKKAFRVFQQVLQQHPDYIDAVIGIGIVYDQKKEHREALLAYKKALKLEPNNQSVYHYRGKTYYHQGEYAKAIADLRKSSGEGPYFVDSLYYLGLALYANGQKDEGKVRLAQALRLAPNREDIRRALKKM